MKQHMWCQSLFFVSLSPISFRVRSKLSAILASALMVVVLAGSFGSPAFTQGKDAAAVTKAKVITRALSQLGVKYTWAGETPQRGFDCSGLTKWSYGGEGVYLPHSSLMQYQLAGDNGYKRIRKRRNLIKGDLVFFKTTSAKVGHVGIYMGGGEFVNSRTGGVQVDELSMSYWDDRWVGGTRVPIS
jgi:murein DD-endopeptidase